MSNINTIPNFNPVATQPTAFPATHSVPPQMSAAPTSLPPLTPSGGSSPTVQHPMARPRSNSTGGFGKFLLAVVLIVLLMLSGVSIYFSYTSQSQLSQLRDEVSTLKTLIQGSLDSAKDTNKNNVPNNNGNVATVSTTTCPVTFPELKTDLATEVEELSSDPYLNFFDQTSKLVVGDKEDIAGGIVVRCAEAGEIDNIDKYFQSLSLAVAEGSKDKTIQLDSKINRWGQQVLVIKIASDKEQAEIGYGVLANNLVYMVSEYVMEADDVTNTSSRNEISRLASMTIDQISF